MPTSGRYLFNPDLAEIVDEAFERCRIDPALITARHIESARRSIRFMCADWATEEHHEFRIRQRTVTLTQGTGTYTGADTGGSPPWGTNVIDVLGIVLRRSGYDTPMTMISRSDHLDLPNKTQQGRPDQYYVNKQRDALSITLWPIPENSTDQLILDLLVKFEDGDAAAQNADIPYYMFDAFASGLAARLAEKYAPPELEEKLWLKAGRALKRGTVAQREPGDIRLTPVNRGRGGARIR